MNGTPRTSSPTERKGYFFAVGIANSQKMWYNKIYNLKTSELVTGSKELIIDAAWERMDKC